MNKIDLSIIVPIYNEELVLPQFFNKLYNTLKKIPEYTYEIICVNDGSKDNSLTILKEYANKDKNIKIISFSRNFNKEQALFAGLQNCIGNAAIFIDADLQDPPELILEFIKKMNEGYQIVYGIRKDRKKEKFFKKFTATYFYKIFNLISDNPIPYNSGDFRLITKKVIETIKKINEKQLFMKGIFNWIGFKSIGITYERQKRLAGKTKWNYWKLWNLAIDGITSSSTVPLRIWSYIGFTIAFSSFIYGIYIVLKTFILGINVPGYASLLTFILFFGGIQLIALGILGEYIGRIFIEVKNRPNYIIDEKINFDEVNK